MSDVVDMIMDDHREVEGLFDQLLREPEKRALVLPVVTALLIAHSRAEESEVYPAARDEAGEADDVEHFQQAENADIEGASSMSKAELKRALAAKAEEEEDEE